MRRRNLPLTAIVAIVLSSACGSSPTSNPSPNTSSAVASPTASAKAGTLDPCLLVTMQAAVASIQSQTDFSVTVTQLPSFADGGVEVQGGASGASVAGIYALHSSVAYGFVAFGVNHP